MIIKTVGFTVESLGRAGLMLNISGISTFHWEYVWSKVRSVYFRKLWK